MGKHVFQLLPVEDPITAVVTATTACSGFLPVAQAFGLSLLIIYTFGIGSDARWANVATILYSSLLVFADLPRAVHGEHYPVAEPGVDHIDPRATTNARASPLFPPIMPPRPTSMTVSTTISRNVFAWFMFHLRFGYQSISPISSLIESALFVKPDRVCWWAPAAEEASRQRHVVVREDSRRENDAKGARPTSLNPQPLRLHSECP